MRRRRLADEADRRFPVRIRLALPPGGLGQRFTDIQVWLDANCGADGWDIVPSGTWGVLNDAIAIHFVDATLASAFVARWCIANRAEIADGVFQVRKDAPTVRVPAKAHKTP